MSFEIAREHLKSIEEGYLGTIYTIAAPGGIKELDGYVIKCVLEDSVTDYDHGNLCIIRGNEWDRKKKRFVYMFEKENKVKGKSFKRYRYENEEELKVLYFINGNDKNRRTYEKRIKQQTTGKGSLVRYSYLKSTSYAGIISKITWGIMTDDKKSTWIYGLDYDAICDEPKISINKKAAGVEILETYDINLKNIGSFEKRKKLKYVFEELELTRALKFAPKENSVMSVYKKSEGFSVYAQTPSEQIAYAACNMMPVPLEEIDEVTSSKFKEEFETKLSKKSYEIEKICEDYLDAYKFFKIETLTGYIENEIQIAIDKSIL